MTPPIAYISPFTTAAPRLDRATFMEALVSQASEFAACAELTARHETVKTAMNSKTIFCTGKPQQTNTLTILKRFFVHQPICSLLGSK
jgi:hypothetical protein